MTHGGLAEQRKTFQMTRTYSHELLKSQKLMKGSKNVKNGVGNMVEGRKKKEWGRPLKSVARVITQCFTIFPLSTLHTLNGQIFALIFDLLKINTTRQKSLNLNQN